MGNTRWGEPILLDTRPLTSDAYSLTPRCGTPPPRTVRPRRLRRRDRWRPLGTRGARCVQEGLVATTAACTSLPRICSPPPAEQRGGESPNDSSTLTQPCLTASSTTPAPRTAPPRSSASPATSSETKQDAEPAPSSPRSTPAPSECATSGTTACTPAGHPVRQDHPFTDAGCALLFRDAHRYIRHLAQLADAVLTALRRTAATSES